MNIFWPKSKIHLGFWWFTIRFFSHLRADQRFQPTELDGWWVGALSRRFMMGVLHCMQESVRMIRMQIHADPCVYIYYSNNIYIYIKKDVVH